MTRKDYEAIAAALHRSGMAVTIGQKKTAEYAIRLSNNRLLRSA